MTISMRHFRAISAGAYFALFCMPHLSAKGNANCDQTTVFGTLNMNHSKHNGENNSEVPCSLQVAEIDHSLLMVNSILAHEGINWNDVKVRRS